MAITAYKNLAQKSRKETKLKESIYRGAKNVESELCDYSCNNWSHRKSTKKF
jgi:hypothetical protein